MPDAELASGSCGIYGFQTLWYVENANPVLMVVIPTVIAAEEGWRGHVFSSIERFLDSLPQTTQKFAFVCALEKSD